MPARFGGVRRADKSERARHAAGNGPEYAGAGPGHAFQHLAAADAACLHRCGRDRDGSSRSLHGPMIGYRGLDRARAAVYSRDFRTPDGPGRDRVNDISVS